MAHLFQYWLFLFFKFLLEHLPKSGREGFLNLIVQLLYLILKRYRIVVRKNLEIAFGSNFAEQHYKDWAKRCIRNLLDNFLIVIENLNRTPEEVRNLAILKNREKIEPILKEGKSILFVSAHFWHWEMLGAIMASHFGKANGVAEKLKNRYFNDILYRSRAKFGIQPIPMKGAIRNLIRAIRRNENIFILIDQAVNRGQGIEFPFFGTTSIHAETTNYLSKKFGIPIVHVYISDIQRGKYVIEFEEPIWGDEVEHTIPKELAIIENRIRSNPTKWLWCHRRWKNLGDIYR